MVLQGSVVSVATSFLYCNHWDLLSMMAYNVRPKIYRVVTSTYRSGVVNVSWAMDGIFNIEEDNVRDNFHSSYDMSVLQIVSDSQDTLIGQDTPYTKTCPCIKHTHTHTHTYQHNINVTHL